MRSSWTVRQRKSTSGDGGPFAKAFHATPLKYLDDVPLESALILRKEERLQNMRGFLRKLWRVSGDNSFSPSNVDNLTAELLDRVREAEDEWSKIDRDLIKWFGAAGLAGSFISAGAGSWVPAAATTIAGGVAALASAAHARHSFDKRFPAGFFLKLKKGAKQKGQS